MDTPDPSPHGEMITARNVDLSSCDRELIQFPDAIQPHGVMLTVDEQSRQILHASANAAKVFGTAPQALLGKNASHVLGRIGHDLIGSLRRMALDSGPVHVVRESFVGSDRGFHLFAHRSGGLIVLELESAAGPRGAPLPNLFAELRADLAKLQATTGLHAFLDLAVQRIRSFTGYDRVMAYRFDEDGSGEVMAEARRDDIEPYLGLHYPASDIPAPARRMFSLSWIRHLPDVDYTAVPLVAARSPLVTGPVDMSFATLRSVSVMYTDYLRNMGVRSTMVMPLVKEGRLWGLVSAMHHAGARHIPHETRMAAEFLAHSLSLLLAAKEDADLQARLAAMQALTAQLVQAVAAAGGLDALGAPDLLPLLHAQVEAGGAALVTGTDIVPTGATPDADQLAALLAWLATQDTPVLATDRLPTLHPPAAAYAHVASGLLALRVPADQSPRRPTDSAGWLLWFRPEQLAVVNWAGDPRKPVEISETDGEQRLRPRGSFALWQQSVRQRATAWRPQEIDVAHALRRGLVGALGQRTQPGLPPLDDAADGPDHFTETASRELQDQLRGLHHLATQLRRRQGDALDAEGQRQLGTILRITQRMDTLVEALMEHARIGHGTMPLEPVDLDAVLDAVLQALGHLIAARGVEVRRAGRLGLAECHRDWVGEILGTLIGNAIRYNDKDRNWIEIGALPGPPPRYYVRDNGIGIAPADQRLVFRMFHRLPGAEALATGGPLGTESGAGTGLAFARRMVERHGGRMWIDSRPGAGATFFFTLAPEPEAVAEIDA